MTTPPSNTDAARPRHILLVLDYFSPYVGGAETLFFQHAKGLVDDGDRVTVVTMQLRDTPARETVEGIEIVRVKPPLWQNRLLFAIRGIPQIFALARSADVIHTAVSASAMSARIAGLVRRRPVAITVYEVFGDQWARLRNLNRFAALFQRLLECCLLHLFFTYYVCISGFTRQRLLRFTLIPKQRTEIVYPPLDYGFWDRDRWTPRDLKKLPGLSPGSTVFLAFGRPGISKGFEILVQAAVIVRHELPDVQFLLLLGRDPAGGYQRIEQLVAELDLRKTVIIHDSVPGTELPGYIMGSDFVVIPSVSEGFGYSALEAAALGCRVVATGGHAVEEVLDGYAWLAPAGDVAGLADRLVQVARQNPSASVPPRRFTPEKHIQQMQAIYERLMSGSHRATETK